MTAPPPIGERTRVFGLIALLFLALAVRRAEERGVMAQGAGAGPSSGAGSGRFVGSIEAEGFRWPYVVHVPPQYDEGPPLPLLLLLHGSSGSGLRFLEDAGWAELADREGVIVLAPDALPLRPAGAPNRALNPRIWNSGQHPDDRPRSQIDDLAALDALLTEVQQRWKVDPARIYAAGHSNGGAMALRLGAERSGVFAAVASVAGLRYVEPPEGARAVPILAIFGGADPLLPTEGGLSVLPWEVRRTPELLPEVRRWANGLGCPPVQIDFEHQGTVHSFSFPPGRDGATVRFLVLDGHGHAWPGGQPTPGEVLLVGPRTDAIDATEVIWDFLSSWRRPDAPGSSSP
ncbi:alpha/beta hydrolase family esterase [Tautonia sociabilis]|uniref:Polyhydroxybutyrate depolymerase n=1 Tax=Tautonia sociabilis TaxID=2080755 RepID=A0A432MEB5_9BACT|nr:PHB depolymerase family esterase [Tautonia sociabilis]RUL83654.1 hypothetical protein TsocGM_21715 [Tautonia sociabilis]